MTTTAKPRPTGLLKGTDLGDEFLFYDRGQDRVHVLNGTAREIFLLFDGSRTEDEVAAALAGKYEIALEQARDDVAETAHRLRDLGVIAD
jgi:hypothetical protein